MKINRSVDEERYARHILLDNVGVEGQERLLASKVLIVGAGGLGAPVAMYLAAAGVGTIGIADDDRVELSNLQRQIIHTTGSVGEKKVESARQTIRRLNPDIDVETYAVRVTQENVMELIEPYDFIVEAVDNFETRFLINDACVAAEKPFCHGGVARFEGQLMTYVPGQGPCYRCIFEEVPEPCSEAESRDLGILGVIPGIIGSLQGLEVLKYLLNTGTLMTGRMLVFDGLRMKFREVVFRHPSPHCKACGKDGVTTGWK